MSRLDASPTRSVAPIGVIVLLLTSACGASPRVERLVAARHAQAARAGAERTAEPAPSDVSAEAGPLETGPVSGSEAEGGAGPALSGPTRTPATSAAGRSSVGASAIGRSGGGGPASPGPATGSETGPARPSVPVPAEGNGGVTDIGVTATSIKIGATFFNGNYLDKYSQVTEQAAAAYFRYINDQGGVYGRKIDYVTCDTAGTADGTQGCLRKLANDDKVFSMGPSLDFNLDTVQPFLEKQKLPWIGNSGLYPAEFTSPWMFPSQIPGYDVGALIGAFSGRTLGAKRVGVSYLNDVAGPACTDRVRAVGKQVGYEVVVTAGNSQTEGDLTQQVLTVQAARPDAVLFCNDPINTIKFVQAAGRINYRPPKGWVAGFVAADDVPQAMGAAGVGLYGFSAYDFYGSDTAGVRRFREITEHYYPSIFHHFYSQAAYAGAAAMVEAIKSAGPRLTRAGLVAAIRSFNDFDTGMGLRLNFANPSAGKASGIMLQADAQLRWKVVSPRFSL
jgi:branched-chain amino acid transport system substrate-binding protein